MSPRAACMVVLALATATGTAHARDGSRSARVSIEAGPTFDQTEFRYNGVNGYAVGAGVEFGRSIAFTLAAGFEHYPGARTSSDVPWSGTPSGYARVEGGGNKTVLTGAIGARVGLPIGSVEPFVDFGIGLTSLARRGVRYVDRSTGQTLASTDPTGQSAALAEAGAGLRTRRASGYDWTLGVRVRAYSQLFEGENGGSVQVRLGIVTP
jgi:hypothetical protein